MDDKTHGMNDDFVDALIDAAATLQKNGISNDVILAGINNAAHKQTMDDTLRKRTMAVRVVHDNRMDKAVSHPEAFRTARNALLIEREYCNTALTMYEVAKEHVEQLRQHVTMLMNLVEAKK